MHQQPQRRRLERSTPQRRQGPRATYQDAASASETRPARATQGARPDYYQPPATRPVKGPPARAKERGQGTTPAATYNAASGHGNGHGGQGSHQGQHDRRKAGRLTTSHNRKRGDGGASLANTQGANGPHRTKAGRIPNGRRPAGGVSSPNDLNGCAPNT